MSRDPLAKVARLDADIAALQTRLNAKLDERRALLTSLVDQGNALQAQVAAQVQAMARASTMATFGRALTDDQVREIRRLHKANVSQSELGRRYGLSQPSIYKIVRRETYQDVAS